MNAQSILAGRRVSTHALEPTVSDPSPPADAKRSKTVFVDAGGRSVAEVPRLFVPIYEGMLFDLEDGCVMVTAVNWDLDADATTCRLDVVAAPAELIDDGAAPLDSTAS